MTDLLTRIRSAAEFDKGHYLAIVEEWQTYWMNQKQNSEEDYQNYWRRAFGVDANMRHSLADMIAKDTRPLIEKLLAALQLQNAVLEKIYSESWTLDLQSGMRLIHETRAQVKQMLEDV